MAINFYIKQPVHPHDAKNYDTQRLRDEFLLDNIFNKDSINLYYSFYDRYIVGGIMPGSNHLDLESIDPLKSSYFLERREMGLINVGDKGCVHIDGDEYVLDYKDGLYIGKGARNIQFSNQSGQAMFYMNSAPAHMDYPIKKIVKSEAEVVNLGNQETSNERTIYKLIVHDVVETNQLQMGMTELKPGSVWNTMPPHTHDRRMEVYFYFEVPDDQAVCHFMGEAKETRHIFAQNNQAVISPAWSLHSGAGTSNYTFIWGMAGENMDYGDMDVIEPTDLK
jgi:4-deoxy-L-threo-5-hexosulose-uronate ketol-isomerase